MLGTDRDFLQVPQANQERSFKVPSPPRIFVPPPIITRAVEPSMDFVQRVKDFESIRFSGPDFLQLVTYGNWRARDHVIDWKYEERRTAQEILPFLFLGPVAAARDRAWLQEHGITMVLGVRDALSAHAMLLVPKAPADLGIPLVHINIRGTPQLVSAFPNALETINTHLTERYKLYKSQPKQPHISNPIPGRVLVFCETGNERSATLVAAYIMAMYSVDLVSAIQIVQSQRFCVAIDDPLKWLLKSYEDILKAKRDVANATNQAFDAGIAVNSDYLGSPREQLKPGMGTRKRSMEQMNEEEVTMADATENDSNTGQDSRRAGTAPFSVYC